MREKAMNAMKAFVRSDTSVIFRAKKRGRKMKRFLMYWCGRISLMSAVDFNTIHPPQDIEYDYTKNLLYSSQNKLPPNSRTIQDN
jgi:hypothetical protein